MTSQCRTTQQTSSQATPVSCEEAAILARVAPRAYKLATNTSNALTQGTFVFL